MFGAVEGNTTFYSLPSAARVARWAELLSEDFHFCAKLPREVSHGGRLDASHPALKEFFSRMAPLEQRLMAAETKLRRLRTNTAAVNKETTRIAQQLVAFPGGSPLLEQLRRVTPVGVQLQALSVGKEQIQLSGRAQIGASPGPLERINALVLSLSQLPITLEQGVKVMKISREDGDDPAVTFSVEWALDPKVRLSLIQLQELGAIGLAERYRLIEQRGVQL